MRIMIKICGVTRVEDALCAVDEGADFIGLNFVPSSSRRVDRDQGRRIVSALRSAGSTARVVGVFVDESPSVVKSIHDQVGLDLIQFHGSESPQDLAAVGMESIKVFRISDSFPDTSPYRSASWYLFDTFTTASAGGTGLPFDWNIVASAPRTKPFFLAGGLRPENVRRAVAMSRPDGLDVASGVEEKPGIKSRERIRQLVRAVRKES